MKMASRSEEDPLRECLENIATCPICFEVMVQPKQLRCGHAFCLKCLKRYAATQVQSGRHRNSVNCATCRQPTPIPENGIKDLPAFFLAESAKESLEKADKSIITNSKSRCSRPKHNRPLNMWCTTCSELICDVCCNNEHLRHNILTVNEALEIVNQLFEDCLKENSEYKTQIDNIDAYKKILNEQKDNYIQGAKKREEEEFKKRLRDIEMKAEEIERKQLAKLQVDNTRKKLEIAYTRSKNTTDDFQLSIGNVEQQLMYLGRLKPSENIPTTTYLKQLQPNPFATELLSLNKKSIVSSSIVSSMEDDMQSFCITTIQDAFKNNLPPIGRSKIIVQHMNSNYGKSWNCFIGKEAEISHGFEQEYYFQAEIAGNLLILSKTPSTDEKCFPDGTVSRPVIVNISNDIDMTTSEKVLSLIKVCLSKGTSTRNEIAKWMIKALSTSDLRSLQKEPWQCVVSGGMIAMQKAHGSSKHILIRVGQERILLFNIQPPRLPSSARPR
ncbi:uncharacterized protein [Antedon mediterranea]|uniref:uncharacterized protein n=1 Tax=Antedon mediterranea TaxID=105859 RepID=UPI003AF7E594